MHYNFEWDPVKAKSNLKKHSVSFEQASNEIEIIRAKLIKSEQSGFMSQTREEILAEFKEELRQNGHL